MSPEIREKLEGDYASFAARSRNAAAEAENHRKDAVDRQAAADLFAKMAAELRELLGAQVEA